MALTINAKLGSKPKVDASSQQQHLSTSSLVNINLKEEIIKKNNERIEALEVIVNSILLNS